MDKRWIYILIIAIIGVACGYYIVESSSSVGSANINVDTFVISVPDGFNINSHSGKYLSLINRNSLEMIQIKDLGRGNALKENISDKINNLSRNENVTFINETTYKIGNETYPSIYYEKIDDIVDRVTFVSKYDHLFLIECHNFHDNQTIKENTQKVIDSLKPDYKQKQD